jgi:hypothetical protein
MVSIGSLWLPIVVSAVIAFVASSIVWMVLKHHKNDWVKLPDEEGILAAMRKAGVKPGQYGFPNCGGDMKEMQKPEFVAKLNQGPFKEIADGLAYGLLTAGTFAAFWPGAGA